MSRRANHVEDSGRRAPRARRQLEIALASPVRAGVLGGNGTSAARWRAQWRELGHAVRVTTRARAPRAQLLVALHAVKCAAAIDEWFERERGPLVVVLSGTDLHGGARARLRRSLERADRIVALEPNALEALAPEHARKARCILQSSPRIPRARPRRAVFELAVVAGLRRVKDPLRPAMAMRGLPPWSKLHVTHYGPALDDRIAARAARLDEQLAHYTWHGARPRADARALLARARALCLPSRSEGGANVLTEAIAARCPVLCSAIPGNLGILGADWPGSYPVGDTRALRELLLRFEEDAELRAELRRRMRALAPLVQPSREKRAWRALFDELTRACGPRPSPLARCRPRGRNPRRARRVRAR